MCSTTSGHLQELKNKGNDRLVISKSGHGHLPMPEWSLMRAFNYRV